MPRQQKKTERPIAEQTLVLDNGAYTMKAGFAGDEPKFEDCHIIPNCITRSREGGRNPKIYIADQLDACRDFAELAFRRPVEKGFLVNWDGELDIWKHSFFDKGARLRCEPHDTNLVLMEAPNCPQALQSNCDQMIFEEFEFASAYRCVGPSLNAYNDIAAIHDDSTSAGKPDCILVIDSGFSHTTVTPILNGRPIQSAIRRLEVGGKLLTNRLKSLISQRHFNLMDESYIVNQIREDTCFVSLDFKRDLAQTWTNRPRRDSRMATTTDSITLDYVLPDYHNAIRGFARPHDPTPPAVRLAAAAAQAKQLGQPLQLHKKEDFFPLGNERFVVPELLFNPSDISLRQAGLAEVIVQSLDVLPTGLWPALLANVVVVGGTSKTPGFRERLELDLRSLAPVECKVRVGLPDDPIRYTWLGGAKLASNKDLLREVVVTRDEYLENGGDWTRRKFAAGIAS